MTDSAPGEVKETKKMSNLMEAANALSSLGGEEETAGETPNASGSSGEATTTKKGDGPSSEKKRYIPGYKKPDAAVTFPEKLMEMMQFADKQEKGFCVEWLDDGKSFIINNSKVFTDTIIPKFFKATKFSSFTRKLYRWGFRQINRGIGPEDPIIFGNDNFQRDNLELMAEMRSVTAASVRRQEQAQEYGLKRGMQDVVEMSQKRMMYDPSFLAKAPFMGGQPFTGYHGYNMAGNMGDQMSLANAIRPGLQANVGQQPSESLHGNPYQANGNGMNNAMMNYLPQGSYPNANAGSTADIVNAAIAALRYAN